MVRPSQVPLPEDILTRAVSLPAVDDPANSTLSPQSKLIEVLQMLQYKKRFLSGAQGDAAAPSGAFVML